MTRRDPFLAPALARAGLAGALLALCLFAGREASVPFNSDLAYAAALAASGWDIGAFRTPPSPYLFPDLALFALGDALAGDPVGAYRAAGLLQIALVALAAFLFAGPAATGAVLALYALAAPELLHAITHHTSLVALGLGFAMLRPGPARVAVAGLATASDPLFIAIWLLAPLCRRGPPRLFPPAETLCVALGFAVSILFSETSLQAVRFAAVVAVAVAGIALARRSGLIDRLPERLRLGLLCAAAALLCALAAAPAAAGAASAKYALPVGATLLLLSGAGLAPRGLLSRGRRVEFPVAVLLVAAGALLAPPISPAGVWREAGADLERWRCAACALEARRLETVAADYWDAKPLFVAARETGSDISIVQIDLKTATPETWIAPYAFVGGRAGRLLLDRRRCEGRGRSANCRTDWPALPAVTGREGLCEGMELVAYAAPTPAPGPAREAAEATTGKTASLIRNLRQNVLKALGRRER